METLAINSDLSKQETEDQALLFDGIVATGLLSLCPLSSSGPAKPEAQHTPDPRMQSSALSHTSCSDAQTGLTFGCGY